MDHLKELHELGSFWTAIRDLKAQVPAIPPHDPDDPHSVERWKHDSAKRQGFELALSHLGVSLDE